MINKSLAFTATLVQIIGNGKADMRSILADMSIFRRIFCEGTTDPQLIYQRLILYLDEQLKNDFSDITCKRGCAFCCRQNVNLSMVEAVEIINYCKTNRINIDTEILKNQLRINPLELYLQFDVNTCIFLQNNECLIYPVRPIACRTFNSVQYPFYCDSKQFPNKKIGVRVSIRGETAISSIIDLLGKIKRFPEWLIELSNK